MGIESTGFLSGSQISADKVDGFDANSTPTASTILPLDSNGKFPGSIIVAASIQDAALANANIGLLNRFARPSKLLAGDGTTLKLLRHSTSSYQGTPADGDKLFMYFICDGTETKLELGTHQNTNRGIFTVYLNNVLDTGGSYDDYAGAGADSFREIVLSGSVVKGLNTVEIRVTGKNASSSSYSISVYGASLQ